MKYFGEEDTGEVFEYSIDDFLVNGDLTKYHDIDVTENSPTSVSQEQSTFKIRECGEMLPLQRRHVAQPKKWAKNQRVFDLIWGDTFDSSNDNLHCIPKCTIKKMQVGLQ